MKTARTLKALTVTLSIAALASGCVVRAGSGADVYEPEPIVVVDEVYVDVSYPGCITSNDCYADEFCRGDGLCIEAFDGCYSDDECFSDEHCGLDGLCYQSFECYDDYDCGPGSFCSGGSCFAEEVVYYGCRDDLDCPAGSWCGVDALCEAIPCYDDYDCGSGAYCDLDDYCTQY